VRARLCLLSLDTSLITKDISVSCPYVIFHEAVFPFAASPHLTNDLDIFLQDGAPGAVPCQHL
jgi:hypothetical protein